jgi:hypothetical protein
MSEQKEWSEVNYPKGAVTVCPELFPDQKQGDRLEYSTPRCSLAIIHHPAGGVIGICAFVVTDAPDVGGALIESLCEIKMTSAEAVHIWKTLGRALQDANRIKDGDGFDDGMKAREAESN